MEPIRLYCGSDKREAIGLSVFCSSVWSRASVPVSITPLTENLAHLWGGQRDGSNQFIFGRFLIPYLQGYKGWAIFADGADMILQDDIANLWALRDDWKAVQCVQHDYKTKHPVKYMGATNEDYPRKNWSSLMLINCAHFAWRKVTPEYVEKSTGANLHRFQFIDDRYIGALPWYWNFLVGEYPKCHDPHHPKLLHYTIGLPAFSEYAECDYATEWRRELNKAMNIQG